MLKQMMIFILALAIFSNAFASTHQSLKSAFQDLTYSLTVEWDQQDKDFYAEQMRKFTATLADLQAQGLSHTELMSFATSLIQDKQVARDIQVAFNLVAINKMPADEASKFMLETLNKSQVKGASWTGGVAVYYTVMAVLVVAIVVVIATGENTSGSYTGGPQCTQVYQCQPFCYNDAVWGYSCQQQCFWNSLCY